MIGLLGCSYFANSLSVASTTDPYPAFELPIFHGGYDIKKSNDPAGGSKTLTYRVRLNSQAAEIVEFYDSFFNGKGWISSFEICQRHWEVSDANAANDRLHIKRMFASWAHPTHDLKVVLWLKQAVVEQQDLKGVKVECRLQSKTDK